MKPAVSFRYRLATGARHARADKQDDEKAEKGPQARLPRPFVRQARRQLRTVALVGKEHLRFAAAGYQIFHNRNRGKRQGAPQRVQNDCRRRWGGLYANERRVVQVTTADARDGRGGVKAAHSIENLVKKCLFGHQRVERAAHSTISKRYLNNFLAIVNVSSKISSSALRASFFNFLKNL